VAASLLSRPHHAICFVGYCDPDTPGGRLLTTKREQEFTFDKLEYTTPVRTAVHKFDLSAHADREELLAYAQARKPRTVILTHGDPPARAWFAEAFARQKHAPQVIDPVPGKRFEV
jgi:Cft2 family RNA processing exonuclease